MPPRPADARSQRERSVASSSWRSTSLTVVMVPARPGAGGRSSSRPGRLTVHPGEILALVGGNGAGKSTVVRCIARTSPSDATPPPAERPTRWGRPLSGRLLLDPGAVQDRVVG